jgi:glutaredoxin
VQIYCQTNKGVFVFKYIRPILGKVLLFIDRSTSPKPLSRPPQYQERIDHEAKKLAIYQFEACPFCIKVRRAAKRMNLKIDIRDARKEIQFKNELVEGGGIYQVPCLKITKDDGSTEWMYESSNIIRYLKTRFAE